jgi:hypothetical protein
VVTEPDLVARSETFEAALAGGDRSALQAFCMDKAAAAAAAASAAGPQPNVEQAAAEEAETWSFMSLLFYEVG